jgi:prophage antirepressor-like protein
MSEQHRTTDVSILQFQGNRVRTYLDEHGMLWWVAKDVCNILKLENPSKTLARLRPQEKNTLTLRKGIAGNPALSVVNEQGLYRLIFRSDKREANAFQDWVYYKVLPQIRQTGTFQDAAPGTPLADTPKAVSPTCTPGRAERAEISEQLTDIWLCFKRQDIPRWMDNRELAALSGVAYNTARQLSKYLFNLRLLDLEESHPRHLYRLSEQAAKRNPAMYQRLDLHVEILKARKRREEPRWNMDDLDSHDLT